MLRIDTRSAVKPVSADHQPTGVVCFSLQEDLSRSSTFDHTQTLGIHNLHRKCEHASSSVGVHIIIFLLLFVVGAIGSQGG